MSTYGTSSLQVVHARKSWALTPVVKDRLWEITDKLPLSASILFGSTGEEDHHNYLILSDSHPLRKDPLKSLIYLEDENRRANYRGFS